MAPGRRQRVVVHDLVVMVVAVLGVVGQESGSVLALGGNDVRSAGLEGRDARQRRRHGTFSRVVGDKVLMVVVVVVRGVVQRRGDGAFAVGLWGQRARHLRAGRRHLVVRTGVERAIGLAGIGQHVSSGNGGNVSGQMGRLRPRTESTWHLVVIRVRLQVQGLQLDRGIGLVVHWVLGSGHHRDWLMLQDRRGGGRFHFDL